jgi:ABC-2 type transport system permease protein
MASTPMLALIRKDLQLFFSDRRAVIMSFAVPIAIASFFGSIFSGPGKNTERARVEVAIVDQDGSTISSDLVAGASADENLHVTTPAAEAAADAVRRGKTSVAVIVPKGFGESAARAFFGDGPKPALDVLFDPSHAFEAAMVRGVLTAYVMQSVNKTMFGGAGGRQYVDDALDRMSASNMPEDQKKALRDMFLAVRRVYDRAPADTAQSQARGFTMPYTVHEQPMTSGTGVAYNGYAHSFAGMGIQFLLFAATSLGVEMLLERQRGLWKRLRSAPVSKLTLLGGKIASMTIVSLMTLWVSFLFAIVMFQVRISGSIAGFVAVSVTCALMAATFGLLVAALGKTPAATRGVTTLAVLMMVMLGGAWVPTFIFPAWLQRLTLVVPARWAVDGLDAMTWRGIGASGALLPSAMLAGFAAMFAAVAVARFRWEETG